MIRISFILCLLFSGNAKSWGPIGHRVVGEIASKHLSKKAKAEVTSILGRESMAKASTWPDEIKSDPENYRYTFDWHYMSWPNESSSYEPKSSGKLLWAIEEQLRTLKNKKSSADKKKFALRFLIHLVGDLHQPLHVGNGLDRGGNDCKIFFHKEKSNLHRLWDDEMINFKRLSYTEFVDFISYFSSDEIQEFMKGSLLSWAEESKKLRDGVYPTSIESRNYCQKGAPESTYPLLSYPYSFKHFDTVEKRMFQAGVRLAYLLNNTF